MLLSIGHRRNLLLSLRDEEYALMPQYRKKPIVIEAIHWVGHNFDELRQWGAPVTPLPASDNALIIGTLEDGPNCEALHIALLDDWIIRGIKNEFYPCKPDIFDATYEAV